MKNPYPLYLMLGISALLLAIGCSDSPKKIAADALPKDSVTVQEPVADTENLLVKYDRVKQVLREWNDAISRHKPEALNALYADNVECYLKTLNRTECVAAKTKWLQAHAGYEQTVDKVEVYYFTDDTNQTVLVAEFDKICTENDGATVVPSLLYFSEFNGEWKITKETDEATDLLHAKKAPVQSLKNGKYNFTRSYESDTRDIPGFGHQSVFYDFSLYLDITNESITGEYHSYSGTMRETTNYLIPEGKITNGILELTVVYNNGEEEITLEDYDPNSISPNKIEHWHLKIVNDHELVCLDADNGYLYAKSLWLTEPTY